MGLKSWLIKFLAKQAGKKLGLTEGPMTDKKKWYKSKTVLTALVTALLGMYGIVDAQIGPAFGFDLPQIPAIALTILGALGIYGRAAATKEIG